MAVCRNPDCPGCDACAGLPPHVAEANADIAAEIKRTAAAVWGECAEKAAKAAFSIWRCREHRPETPSPLLYRTDCAACGRATEAVYPNPPCYWCKSKARADTAAGKCRARGCRADAFIPDGDKASCMDHAVPCPRCLPQLGTWTRDHSMRATRCKTCGFTVTDFLARANGCGFAGEVRAAASRTAEPKSYTTLVRHGFRCDWKRALTYTIDLAPACAWNRALTSDEIRRVRAPALAPVDCATPPCSAIGGCDVHPKPAPSWSFAFWHTTDPKEDSGGGRAWGWNAKPPADACRWERGIGVGEFDKLFAVPRGSRPCRAIGGCSRHAADGKTLVTIVTEHVVAGEEFVRDCLTPALREAIGDDAFPETARLARLKAAAKKIGKAYRPFGPAPLMFRSGAVMFLPWSAAVGPSGKDLTEADLLKALYQLRDSSAPEEATVDPAADPVRAARIWLLTAAAEIANGRRPELAAILTAHSPGIQREQEMSRFRQTLRRAGRWAAVALLAAGLGLGAGWMYKHVNEPAFGPADALHLVCGDCEGAHEGECLGTDEEAF